MASNDPIEVHLLRYSGSQATAVHGLTDLFAYANFFAQSSSDRSGRTIRVSHWQGSAEGLDCVFDSLPGPPGPPAVIIVPASQMAPPPPGMASQSLDWIRERHGAGAVAAAVCGGVFLLAESGVLAGRRATTHWMFAAELSTRFPDVEVAPDRILIDDGDIVTAGGVLAWADLGLSLVERLLGPAVSVQTARFMLFDVAGREQRFYSGFVPPLQHGDRPILHSQRWLHSQQRNAVTVAELAGRAGLGERTFLRRFTRATGMTPMEYHQRLRVARARELLELTTDTVETVAATIGYEDAGGFRRTFKRIVGLSPGEYRRRFAPAGREARMAGAGAAN